MKNTSSVRFMLLITVDCITMLILRTYGFIELKILKFDSVCTRYTVRYDKINYIFTHTKWWLLEIINLPTVKTEPITT